MLITAGSFSDIFTCCDVRGKYSMETSAFQLKFHGASEQLLAMLGNHLRIQVLHR